MVLISAPFLYAFILLAFPILSVFAHSFWTQNYLTIDYGFTLENYRIALTEPLYQQLLLRSLRISLTVGVATILLAFPMAYFLALKANPKYRVALLVLVMAPFWTSQLLRYYAWIMLLGGKGIPAWLAYIGIADVRIINTPWAVLIGAVYGFLPLMVPPIYVSLEKLDKRLLEASADLGATPTPTLFQVNLPRALPGHLDPMRPSD